MKRVTGKIHSVRTLRDAVDADLHSQRGMPAEAQLAPVEGVAPAVGPMEPVMSLPAGQSAPPKPQTVREFEAALTGLGFSRREAKAIAASGFAAAPDESQDADALVAAFQAASELISSKVTIHHG